jgi:hypothetical protein
MPVVGLLSSRSPDESKHLVAAFRVGLQIGGGYVEGQNITIEYRWAEGQYGRLPELAIDLVRRGVAVLVATGGEPSALAATWGRAAQLCEFGLRFMLHGRLYNEFRHMLHAVLYPPEGPVAVCTSRRSCRTAEKAGKFAPVRESSGESRLIGGES